MYIFKVGVSSCQLRLVKVSIYVHHGIKKKCLCIMHAYTVRAFCPFDATLCLVVSNYK